MLHTYPDTTLDLIRHGEPKGGQRYRGTLDDPLSATGWQQMQQATENEHWELILSSPLQRCHAFACTLANTQALPAPITDPGWQEIGMGAWEGKTPDQVKHDDPDGHAACYRDPMHARPRHGEELTDFQHRVLACWQRYLPVICGKRVLLVAHAGVLRVLFCHFLDAPLASMYRMRIGYAGRMQIRFGAGMPLMVTL